MIFCSALFTLMLAVYGDAGVVPRALIQTPESGLTKRSRTSKTKDIADNTKSIADNVDKLAKGGMDRKKLIIVLSVLLVVIIICCVTAAVILRRRRKEAKEEEKEERRQEKAKKKQDARRQAEPREYEDDDEGRTLVNNSIRPSMQVDPFSTPYGSSPHPMDLFPAPYASPHPQVDLFPTPYGSSPSQADLFPTPYGSSLHPQEDSQFSSHSNRASYSSDRRVEAVREEAAPFLNNAGMQHSA